MDPLLHFWFGPLGADGMPTPEYVRRWFAGGPDFDAELRAAFGALHAEAASGGLADWEATPRGAMALVLLLDQLSRNLGRGTPAMFTNDARALAVAERMLARGDDRALPAAWRPFVYLPFMHAEDLATQERSVASYQGLASGDDPQVGEALRGMFLNNLKFAVAHRDIVARFGRFPHRNATLGRPSTAEEEAFLREPGSSF